MLLLYIELNWIILLHKLFSNNYGNIVWNLWYSYNIYRERIFIGCHNILFIIFTLHKTRFHLVHMYNPVLYELYELLYEQLCLPLYIYKCRYILWIFCFLISKQYVTYLHINTAISWVWGYKMHFNLSKSENLLTTLISIGEFNRSSLRVVYKGQNKRKWDSSSTFWLLQRVHFLSCLLILLYLSISIWRGWDPSRRHVKYFRKCLSLIIWLGLI